MAAERTTTLYCSFCGKSQYEVAKLIAGPVVFICNECVSLSVDVCLDDGIAIAGIEAPLGPMTANEVTSRTAFATVAAMDFEAAALRLKTYGVIPPLVGGKVAVVPLRDFRALLAQGLDPKDESPVGNADAPNSQSQSTHSTEELK
jgi:hypothetical protein